MIKKNNRKECLFIILSQIIANIYQRRSTITMPTKLPTMTSDTKLPTLTGLSTGLKSTQATGTSPRFDAEFNDYMNDKQIYA